MHFKLSQKSSNFVGHINTHDFNNVLGDKLTAFAPNTTGITEPMNTKLNKIKKTDPEAFFYLYQMFEIVKNNKEI